MVLFDQTQDRKRRLVDGGVTEGTDRTLFEEIVIESGCELTPHQPNQLSMPRRLLLNSLSLSNSERILRCMLFQLTAL
jgi:hypothetical protein